MIYQSWRSACLLDDMDELIALISRWQVGQVKWHTLWPALTCYLVSIKIVTLFWTENFLNLLNIYKCSNFHFTCCDVIKWSASVVGNYATIGYRKDYGKKDDKITVCLSGDPFQFLGNLIMISYTCCESYFSPGAAKSKCPEINIHKVTCMHRPEIWITSRNHPNNPNQP